MSNSQSTFHAFTIQANGLLRKLITDVTVVNGDKIAQVKALWDTGATTSCITEELAHTIGLIPTGMNTIYTASGTSDVNTYLTDIILPNNVVIKKLPVSSADLKGHSIDALIGMDVISMGDLAVSNYNQRTVFTFRIPSKETTDYVRQYNREKIVGTHGKGKRKKKKK